MNYRSLGNGINEAVECIDTLANILALTLGTSVTQTTVPVGSKARPTDVVGCTLEMGADGLWAGASVGSLTQGQADALAASGAMGRVEAGTRATVGLTESAWNGSAWEKVASRTDYDVFQDVYWPGIPDSSLANIGDIYQDPVNKKLFKAKSIFGITRFSRLDRVAKNSFSSPPILSWIGDSIGTGQWAGQGPLEYICALSNGYLQYGRNASVGSKDSAYLAGDFDLKIRKYPYDICFIQMLTNDITEGVSYDLMVANIQSILTKISIDGKKGLLVPPPPHNNTDGYYNAIKAMNYLAVLNGVAIFDIWAPFLDKYRENWITLQSTISGDGTHPTSKTRWDAAKLTIGEVAEVSSPVSYPSSNADPASLFNNTWFATDTNSDGIPDGWLLAAGTCVQTLVASTIGNGNAVKFDGQGGTSKTLFRYITVVPGKHYQVVARAKCTNLSLDAAPTCLLRYTTHGVNKIDTMFAPNVLASGNGSGVFSFACDWLCPDDVKSVNFQIGGTTSTASDAPSTFTGQIEISDVMVRAIGDFVPPV